MKILGVKRLRCELFYKRCKEFLSSQDIRGLEDYCKKEARETVFRIVKYIEFWDDYLCDIPIGTISEGALRPVIEEGDPDVAVKVAEKVKTLIVVAEKKKRKPKITGEVVKKVLAEVKGEVYLTPAEKKQLGGEAHLKKTEAACDEFLSMDLGEQQTLLKDLRAIVDLLGTWGARTGPNLRAKIEPVKDQVNTLRNELILFLPEETERVAG